MVFGRRFILAVLVFGFFLQTVTGLGIRGFAKTNLGPKNVTIPVAVSVFPDEVYHTPRTWAEQAYPNLIHYNQLDKGGHFAAWE